jgi:hypothetical protein
VPFLSEALSGAHSRFGLCHYGGSQVALHLDVCDREKSDPSSVLVNADKSLSVRLPFVHTAYWNDQLIGRLHVQ